MKKINWCKILGHKWVPIYTIGWFADKKVKFIGCECKRCNYGEDDLRETIAKMHSCHVNSYDEKYYN